MFQLKDEEETLNQYSKTADRAMLENTISDLNEIYSLTLAYGKDPRSTHASERAKAYWETTRKIKQALKTLNG